jgi:hypothetical protein
MATLDTDPAMRLCVPPSIVLYGVLGLLDYALTLMAFRAGLGEANPVLAWFANHGLFEFAKLSMTLLVVAIAFHLRHKQRAKFVMAVANAAMFSLLVYHGYLWWMQLGFLG